MGDAVRPTGTVTFLFTDVEGSTGLWDRSPDVMGEALALHDRLLRGVFESRDGFVFATGGDGFAVAFGRVQDAVDAAAGAQQALADAPWPPGAALRVRMGVHVGEVEERDGDYFGPAVNRAARIMGAGHGGQVLVSSPVEEISSGHNFVSLGHHRLQGFGSPDELWQLGSGVFAPLRSARQEGNLPEPASSFVGRAAELDTVSSLLGDTRLVTLAGVGGVGKTRLAIEAARAAANGFVDGVWFVDLAPRRDRDGVIEATAATVGAVAQAGEALLVSLLNHLGPRRALLVLDNCEHVLDGAAELCAGILADTAGVSVVATSREPLGIPGEQVWAMPSLAQSAELFVERAGKVTAGFSPSTEELEVIGSICDRLDGIPLAIELAAARTRSMTVTEIADALQDRFRLLRGSGRGGVERHQTLQATVQWSYDLLDEADRDLFVQLSVFAATFDVAAVEAIIGGPSGLDVWDVREGLDRLVERNLVQADRTHSVTRFRLLETFRQFGEQRLAAATAVALRRAHLGYFADMAWDTSFGFYDRVDDPVPDPWVLERANIFAAMHWALADDDHAACARIAEAYCERAGWSVDLEFWAWVTDAGSHPDALAPTIAAASAATGTAGTGDFGTAITLARRAIALDPDYFWGWGALAGTLQVSPGQELECADACNRAAALAHERSPTYAAMHQGLRANVLATVDPPTAALAAEQAAALLPTLGPRGALIIRILLAQFAMRNGDIEQALERCDAIPRNSAADPENVVSLAAYRVRAEATALLPGADPSGAFLSACEVTGETGLWGNLWRVMVTLARWWNETGKPEPAALIIGCAAAHDVMTAGLGELADALDDPTLEPARQRGRHMSRNDLLDYAIAELDPVAAHGTIAEPVST